MRLLAMYLLLVSLAACGPSESTSSVSEGSAGDTADQVTDAHETINQAMGGGNVAAQAGEEACAVFEGGMISELFAVEASLISYRRAIPIKRIGHVVCLASWDKPDKAEQESEYAKSMQEWTRGMATGSKEPMPKYPKLVNDVSITLMATDFESADAAVANLESSVATLRDGVTVNVAGKDHSTQVGFSDWIDKLGDRAIFTDKGELLLADRGQRISVNVNISADESANRAQAITLARKLMDVYSR